MIITINTQLCTEEELQTLLKYLDNEAWDYRVEKEKK